MRLFLKIFAGALVIIGISVWGFSSRPTPSASKAKKNSVAVVEKPSLAERGSVYRIDTAAAGAVSLDDRDEVRTSAAHDREGFLELMLQGRAGLVQPGDKVRVIDQDVSILKGGVWVQVRVIEGLMNTPVRGLGRITPAKFWIPQSALEGFEEWGK